MRATFAFYCICGAAMTGEVDPASGATTLEAAFDSFHSGKTEDGHGRTDRLTAHAARQKKGRAPKDTRWSA